MAISMSEALDSRNGETGEKTSFDLIYYTFGEPDEVVAGAYVLKNIPKVYDNQRFRTASRELINYDTYKFTCNYGSDFKQINVDEVTESFTTIGGTSHITNSLKTTRFALKEYDDIDYGGAIGVELNDDGSKARIRGVEVYTPVCDFSLSTQFNNSDMSDLYFEGLRAVTGCTNQQQFYRRPAGSVLFKGARGSRKGNEKWEMSFDFSYSPNVRGIKAGKITGINKNGWQYLDILYKPAGWVKKLRILEPGVAFVHDVYEDGNFSLLGIGVG